MNQSKLETEEMRKSYVLNKLGTGGLAEKMEASKRNHIDWVSSALYSSPFNVWLTQSSPLFIFPILMKWSLPFPDGWQAAGSTARE
jgi:hypothetical protein